MSTKVQRGLATSAAEVFWQLELKFQVEFLNELAKEKDRAELMEKIASSKDLSLESRVFLAMMGEYAVKGLEEKGR